MFRAAWLAGSFVAAFLVVLSAPRLPADDAQEPEAKPKAGSPGSEVPKSGRKPDGTPDTKRGPGRTDDEGSPIDDRFMRVTRDRKGVPQSLDTAIVRYVPARSDAGGAADLAVDLVGAVHIGEKAYYRTLNKLFEEYDVVLFELVMAEGTRVPDGRPRGDSLMGNMVKSMLELESQVERIDYTKKNFVHADMSPAQMREAMRKRGDDGLTVTLSVITDMIREANRREQKSRNTKARRQPAEIDLFGALFGNNTLELKRSLADQMEESGDAGAFGSTLTTMLITDRNEACLKVLDRELRKGHRKIAIFYGAAHLPDFDKRLTKDFNLKADRTTWLTAWDLTD